MKKWQIPQDFIYHSIASACSSLNDFAQHLENNGYKTKAFYFLTICQDIITHTLNEKRYALENQNGSQNDFDILKLNLFEEMQMRTASRLDKVRNEISQDKYPVVFNIQENDDGYGFETLIKSALNGDITWMKLYDPYLVNDEEFVYVRELISTVAKHEKNLEKVLITSNHNHMKVSDTKSAMIDKIETIIAKHFYDSGIRIEYADDPYLHDRRIEFSNRFLVSLGRGVGIYQKNENLIENCEKRKCRKTDIYVYKSRNKLVYKYGKTDKEANCEINNNNNEKLVNEIEEGEEIEDSEKDEDDDNDEYDLKIL